MRQSFLVWLAEAVGVGLIAIMQMDRYKPDDPVARYAIITFGALLFVAALFYQVIRRVGGVMRTVPAVQKAFQRANKKGDIAKWRSNMITHRVRNFFWSLLFVVVALGLLLFGIYTQVGWFSPVHRIIEIVFAGFLLLISLVTMVNYLVLIVRGKK